MYISADRIAQVFPATPVATLNTITPLLFDEFQKRQINTLERVSMFFAQCGVESGGFTQWEENLNYSAQGLLKTWPTHFTIDQARAYAYHPQAIANRAYADRMGNGPESSGDGWKYRGRGAIQVTGHDNYAAFAADQGITVDQAIALLGTYEGGVKSAGWFWNRVGMNPLADTGDVRKCTLRVNAGLNGLADRQRIYDQCTQIFASDD